ncbi:putative C-mannosyltransferase [Armadillidium nasatum]|uniref:Putative C-mannosyltransferase n=1 Tax=Armadillidium nasatum TaxID=96803 RepID=A0A5N5TM50_9CRUS|nr:putative C-mannosyltransferase [Armadillidium nasatum]
MVNKNRKFDEEKQNKNRKSLNKDINIRAQAPIPIPKEKETNKFPNFKVLLACAVCCGLIHSYHVSTLFENDTHFSHLSTLEREMIFRTEMVVLGGSYRVFTNVLAYFDVSLPLVCWKVSRGDSLPPVLSCEGIGEPVYWYLFGVWICAGFTAALLFLSGAQLSRSLAGGFITVICFFFNHGEATRVQWTPPLRESFAFPFSLALNMIITFSLRKPKVSWVQPLLFGNIALNYLLCWQFSQFTLAANIGILYILYSLGVSSPLPMLLTLLGALYALVNALIVQFANSMLLTSTLAGVLVGVFLLYVFIEPLIQVLPRPTNVGVQVAFLFISSLASKMELSRILSIEDDAHIVNLFKSKFTNYSDFHTKLYTCSKEFDILPKETVNKLTETLLLPCVMAVLIAVSLRILIQIKANLVKRMEEREKDQTYKTSIWNDVDAGILFNVVLLIFYAILAILVMRLKLFFTPQLCVISSLLTSRSLWSIFKRKDIHYAVLALLVSSMCIRGFRNIVEQRGIVGEYNDPNLEELLEWINSETGKEESFAGPMATMANVLLSTRRPVVNHPHYESAALRQRTKQVYSVFSRKSSQEVYEIMLSLKVNYLVIEESWCFRRSKPGCGIIDLWDSEEPQKKNLPALCPKLFHHKASPFHRIFSNEGYVVLQVPSKYVEIPAPRVRSS